MRLITRNADGSPTEEQQAAFPWPAEKKPLPQLIFPPKSTDRKKVTQLAYLHAYDVIVDKDYAYVAYKEEDVSTGKWIFKISAKSTAGASIDPNHAVFKTNIESAVKKGQSHMVFGFNLQPKDDDPRLVENRVCFDESQNPTHIEIRVVARKADGSPTREQLAKIDWPE